VTDPPDIRVGTSGWHYRHWVGPFYPPVTRPADFLGLYARRFDTAEINNTFYRLPTPAAVAGWRDATPPGFLFAAKGSRFITHMKKLKDPAEGLRRYLEPLALLGDKLGPVVFQLPPRWRLDLGRLAAFLGTLPDGRRFAFEFRDQSWFAPETYRLLERHGAALCLWDLAGRRSPALVTADFAYVRLHGPGGPYQGSYGEEALAAWAERMLAWRAAGVAAYCYFDNDDRGHAPADALRLARLVGCPPPA
jgi:uncharacterized protein YecE (DUF72 family)